MLVADHHRLDQLQTMADAIPQERTWKRVQTVILAKQGWTAAHVAQSRGCSLRSVKNWIAQYNRGGIEALRERPHTGRPRCLASEHYPRPKRRLDAPPTPEDGVCTLRANDVRRILEHEFGVPMGRQAVYDLLHRLGYGDLRPRPHHEKANPEVREFFEEIVVEQIAAIADDHPEKEVRVYFQDEARFAPGGRSRGSGHPRGRVPERCGRTAASGSSLDYS